MNSPDIIVTVSDRITIFEPQTRRAVEWLQERCRTELDNVHDQIRIDSRKRSEMINALKAAGFTVMMV
jgi:phosphoserine phosphatase